MDVQGSTDQQHQDQQAAASQATASQAAASQEAVSQAAGSPPVDQVPATDAQQADTPPATDGESISEMFKAEVAARAARREGREPDGAATTQAPPAADAGQGKTGQGEAGPGQGQAETAAKPADGPAAAKPDPWAGVDPAIKKQYDEAVAKEARTAQALRSTNGRLSALERQLRATETRPAPESAAAAGGKTGDPKPDAADALRRIREDYPELAPAIDLLEETRQAVQTHGATVGTLAEERAAKQAEQEAEQARKEIAQLGAKHQDWYEIYQSQDFADWKAANPAFGQVADTSQSSAELSRIFDLYKQDTGRATPAPAAATPAADPPNPAPDGATTKPDAGAKRALQLEGSVAVGGKAPAVPTGGAGSDGDTSALWRQEMARRRQQRQARG